MIDTRAIRFGGQDTPGGFQFELSGGAVALDFANTLDERPRGGLERIADYPALALWCVQSGFLTEGKRETLVAAAQQEPAAAAAVHAQALALRELIFATIKATIASEVLSDEQVHCWNDWLKRTQASRRLSWGGSGLAWKQPDIAAASSSTSPMQQFSCSSIPTHAAVCACARPTIATGLSSIGADVRTGSGVT